MLVTARLRKQSFRESELIFVEGADDSLILRYTLKVPPDAVLVCFGKQNVIDSSLKAEADEFLFLVDKDFDAFAHGIPDSVLRTDYYDIENYVIRSEKFDVIVEKFCSRKKCPRPAFARTLVDSISLIFARARYAALVGNDSFKIEEDLIHRCMQGVEDFSKLSDIEAAILRRFPGSATDKTAFEANFKSADFKDRVEYNLPADIWITVFGKLLRKELGSCRAEQSTFDHLHSVFMASIDSDCFAASAWWQTISNALRPAA